MSLNSSSLDEAWAFVEKQLALSVKKKDIVPLLNDAGHRTLKGKLWTYQTLLLEQRRRLGTRVPKGKTQKVTPARPIKKLVVTVRPELKGLRAMIQLGDAFDDSVRAALDANFSMDDICFVLDEKGAKDEKGRSWNPVSLNYHMSEDWVKRAKQAEAAEEPIEIRGGLADFVGRRQKQAEKEMRTKDVQKESLAEKVKQVGNQPREDQASSVPDLSQAWALVEQELKKGTKKKAIVGVLNLGGFTTRRGKPWTYQTLIQEFQRRKNEGPASEVQTQQKAVDSPKLSVSLEAAFTKEEGLDMARTCIQDVILPQLEQKGCRAPSGSPWSYELLLWELLRRDLDLEHILSSGLDRWWDAKKETKPKDAEAMNLFEILN